MKLSMGIEFENLNLKILHILYLCQNFLIGEIDCSIWYATNLCYFTFFP